MKTKVLTIHDQTMAEKLLQEAADCVRQGGLVIFPTETVYGIAADATNQEAVLRLKEVKKRSDHKRFSMMISHREIIDQYTTYTHPKLFKLLEAYCPGALTVIVPSKQRVNDTIGIRIPDHPIALKFLALIQHPILAPSANIEGMPAPQTVQEALKDLNGLVDMAIDGGKVDLGIASTIVDMTKQRPTIIREGSITQQDVDRVCEIKNILFVCTGNSCRSVMAEYMFRHLLKNRTDIRVMSAGTNVSVSTRATQEAIDVLKEEGIDATAHRSQFASKWLLKQADLVFVMTQGHRIRVLETAPEVAQRVYLLGEFNQQGCCGGHKIDIADPIGSSLDEYRRCLSNIKDCFKKIIELV